MLVVLFVLNPNPTRKSTWNIATSSWRRSGSRSSGVLWIRKIVNFDF